MQITQFKPVHSPVPASARTPLKAHLSDNIHSKISQRYTLHSITESPVFSLDKIERKSSLIDLNMLLKREGINKLNWIKHAVFITVRKLFII